MTDFANWLFGLVKDIFLAVWDLLGDVFVFLLDLCLQTVLTFLNATIVPCFMASQSLTNLFANLSAPTLFFVSHFHIPQAFGILGCAV